MSSTHPDPAVARTCPERDTGSPGRSIASNLNHLCEIKGAASPDLDVAEYKPEPGFLPGLLLKAEGRLRRATTLITNTFGAFTLPCLFLGGGILGVAAAGTAFRARMKAINRNMASPFETSVAAQPRRAVRVSPSGVAVESDAIRTVNAPKPAAWTPQQVSSVIASELANRRNQKPWENHDDDDDEYSSHHHGQAYPSATDLFTPKELATLFLLPAATIIFVLSGGWIFFKYQCGIHSMQHFSELVKWLSGNGVYPDAAPASTSATRPMTTSPKDSSVRK